MTVLSQENFKKFVGAVFGAIFDLLAKGHSPYQVNMLHGSKVITLKKKVKEARPGFEPATNRSEGQSANPYTTAAA